MPIHVRAEPGDYAEAVLLPGDPLRAKYIADTYLDDVVQTNSERGMLGFRGSWEGKPVSVQSTGMGCPSAAIVIEELVMLGCKKLLRVGTCGGLQPHHALGDMIVALSAVPQDGTAGTYVKHEPHAPTADWGLVHERRARRRRRSARRSTSARSSRATSSTTRTASSTSAGPTAASSRSRWRPPILFTLGALRKVQAGCLLIVSDIVVEGEFTRITRRRDARGGRPDDARRARDGHCLTSPTSSFS